MLFNVTKSKMMHIGSNNLSYDYVMNGVVLETVDQERDLGVICDKSVKPSQQCVAAVNKANRILVCIRRCLEYKSVKCVKYLYTELVRSHLVFSIQAWSPQLKKDIILLEKTQRRATKLL